MYTEEGANGVATGNWQLATGDDNGNGGWRTIGVDGWFSPLVFAVASCQLPVASCQY